MNQQFEKLKILIVDNEVLIAEDIKDMLHEFGCKKTYMAHSKQEAIDQLMAFAPDLVLLDIRMEHDMEGIELANIINNDFTMPFIFITAHSDVATINKIITTQPYAYITKPVKKSDLFANISLLAGELEQKIKQKLYIKDGYKTIVLNPEDILYLESDGNYINIYTKEKRHLLRQSMDGILSELDPNQFVRVHRSYIINKKHVARFSKKEIEINGVKVPVSRHFSENIETLLK
jgi:DNA-binding LytR/AlgR family response regulator